VKPSINTNKAMVSIFLQGIPIERSVKGSIFWSNIFINYIGINAVVNAGKMVELRDRDTIRNFLKFFVDYCMLRNLTQN
jgi:hypothetical protein